MSSYKFPPTWLTGVVAAANVIAAFDLPYGYYQMLRLVVTGYACYMAYVYFKNEVSSWGWTFSFVALLYNPIFLITMSKEIHTVVNLATAIFIIFERYKLRKFADNSSTVIEPPLTLEKQLKNPQLGNEIGSGGSKIKALYVVPAIIGIALLGIIITVGSSDNFEANEGLDGFDEDQASFSEHDLQKTPLDGASMADGSNLGSTTSLPRYISTPPEPIAFPEAESAARTFVEVLNNSGIIGAKSYSEKCHVSASQTLSWEDLDYCASFDFAAAVMDESVSRETGYERNAYFEEKMKTQAEHYLGQETTVSSRLSLLRRSASNVLFEAYSQESPEVQKSARTYNPSFICTDRLSYTENLICENESLSSKDRQLSAAFKKTLSYYSGSARDDLLAAQRKFLAQRAKCRDVQCIEAWYDERIGLN